MNYDEWCLGDEIFVHYGRPNQLTHLLDPAPHHGDYLYLPRVFTLTEEGPTFLARTGWPFYFVDLPEVGSFPYVANLSASRRLRLPCDDPDEARLWKVRERAFWYRIVTQDRREAEQYLKEGRIRLGALERGVIF